MEGGIEVAFDRGAQHQLAVILASAGESPSSSDLLATAQRIAKSALKTMRLYKSASPVLRRVTLIERAKELMDDLIEASKDGVITDDEIREAFSTEAAACRTGTWTPPPRPTQKRIGAIERDAAGAITKYTVEVPK
jgi:hypothetical protein